VKIAIATKSLLFDRNWRTLHIFVNNALIVDVKKNSMVPGKIQLMVEATSKPTNIIILVSIDSK
jgi:hypothetical protein